MEPTHSFSNFSSISLQNPHFYPSSMFLSSKNLTHHNFNLNSHDEQQQEDHQLDDQTSSDNTDNDNIEREPMFEKHLTPSDVGKLNRLVIPKQHAEKYFPLGGGRDDNKGLLLSFEDESGKCWRFRYSYWNSSQSYVLTKGWSRYVKEKQLDAGDIILFHRHRTDGDRLFIGWRRRGAAVVVAATATATDGRNAVMGNNSGGGGGRGLYQGQPYLGHIQGLGANVPYQLDCLHAGNLVQNQGTAGRNPKRMVRLFGVNLECDQLDESPPSTPPSSTVSSQGPTTHQFY